MMLVESSVDTPAMSPEGCTSPQPSDGEEGKGRVFACTMCSYRTDRKNNLKRHTLTMHELSPALLECCGLRFLNKAELRMHTHKFHRDGYHCDVCGRVFCRKALLKRHYSVHSGFKEFSCHFCGYETSHKSNLERHMRVHRKDGAPLPQHLLEGGFLPELSQPSATFSTAMNFRSGLLPAQPRPVLPLFSDHHPHLYSTPGAPTPAWPAWPVLTPHTPPAPSAPTLPQHLLQKAQQVTSQPEGQTADFLPEVVTPKKQGPRRGFSVSALLGDDPRPDDVKEEKDRVELKPPISSTPLPTPIQTSPGSLHGLFRLPASSPQSLSPDAARVCGSFTSITPTRIQRPTPIHANSPSFAHAQSPVTMYPSVDMHASLQALMHAQSPILSPPASLSIPRCRSPLPAQAESPAAPLSPMPQVHCSFSPPQHPQSPATHAHSPVRAQTPKNDHHDSGASSGYGSPGLDESPRLHAFEPIRRPMREEEEEEEDAGVMKSASLYHHAHVEGAGEQADDEMEVDQEYVPKKLRVSKKYKGMMGSCNDIL